MTALVDEDSVGLIYLDSSGSIIEANERGREVLKADGGLRECRRRLVAHRPEDVAAVERLIGMALEGMVDVPEPTPATLGSWPHQRPLILDARPVSQTSYNKARAAVLVVVVDPWVPTPVSPERVAASLGLTPAESRVAASLAEGKTVAEIARTSDRAPDSVRRLVKQALAKTWCSRQADLVRLVLSCSRLPIPREEISQRDQH